MEIKFADHVDPQTRRDFMEALKTGDPGVAYLTIHKYRFDTEFALTVDDEFFANFVDSDIYRNNLGDIYLDGFGKFIKRDDNKYEFRFTDS